MDQTWQYAVVIGLFAAAALFGVMARGFMAEDFVSDAAEVEELFAPLTQS